MTRRQPWRTATAQVKADALLDFAGSSTLVGLHKLDGQLRYLAVFNNAAAAAQFVGNVDGYISAPSFSDIEGDDADRIAERALHQIADQRLAIIGVFVDLAPRSSEPTTKVIQHKVSVLIRPVGRNGWRGTNNKLPKPTEKTT